MKDEEKSEAQLSLERRVVATLLHNGVNRCRNNGWMSAKQVHAFLPYLPLADIADELRFLSEEPFTKVEWNGCRWFRRRYRYKVYQPPKKKAKKKR